MSNPGFKTQFYARIAEDIEREGRSIIGVFPTHENEGPPFAYTIGNAAGAVELPELLVVGTPRGGFLNDLSRLMLDAGAPFEDGQTVLIPGARLPVKVVRANNTARTEYAIQAGEYFGHDDYPIMQVLMPDRAGKFPDEPGCAAPFSTFPVLRLVS